MRRFHNPRYAPESLERKLSPSGIVAIPVAAEIHIPKTQMNNDSHVSPIVYTTPTIVAPASSKVIPAHVTLDSGTPAKPGDPEPVDPEVPTNGTGPTPPPGDGNPPKGPSSTPSGPDLPAVK